MQNRAHPSTPPSHSPLNGENTINLADVIKTAAGLREPSIFAKLVEALATALHVSHVSISEATDAGFHVIALYTKGRVHRDVPLDYEASPACLRALQQGYACHASGLKNTYPENHLYQEMDVDSYMGIGLRDETGNPIGNLCVLNDSPIFDPESMHSALEVFALRATTEVQRLREERRSKSHSERREREAKVRNQQRADFLENTTDIAQIVRVNDLRFDYVNPAWRHALGYDEKDLETLTLAEILHPNSRSECVGHFQQLQEDTEHQVQPCHLALLTKSGETIHLEGNCCLRRDPGCPPVIQAILRNVTLHQKRHRELRRLVHRNELATRAAQMGIWEWDPNEGQLNWDDQMRALHKIPENQAIQCLEEWIAVVHPEDRSAARRFLSDLEGSTHPQQMEFRILPPDGKPRWMLSHALYAPDPFDAHRGVIVGVTHDITQRNVSESRRQALLNQLRDYKLALDETASIVQMSPNGVVTGVNEKFLELTGFQEADVIGTPYRELGCDLNENACDARIATVLRDARPQQTPLRLRKKNGAERWAESTLVPIMGPKGRVETLLDVQIDTTERMIALESLHEESGFRQQILDQMSDGLAVGHFCPSHPRLRFTVWNPRIREITGFDREDINRIGWIDALFEKGSASHSAAAKYTASEDHFEELSNAIFEITTQKGEQRVVSVSTRFLDNKSNTPALIFIMRDITKRTRAEAFQRQLIAAIGVAGEGIAIVEDGRFVFMNDEHAQLFGYDDAKRCLKMSWERFYPLEERERFSQEIFPALQTRKAWRGVVTGLRKDGGRFDQDLNLRWVSQDRFIGVGQDVTERRLTEQALRDSNHKLELATREKNRFMANMSHELRTPLNAILGLSEGMLSGVFGPLVDRQQASLRSIESSGQHLLSLIEDILDIAKIEAGALQLNPERIPALRIVREATAIMAPIAQRRQVTLEMTAPQGTALYVDADARACRQVVLNLLSNAVKFSKPGGVVEVSVTHSPPNFPKPEIPGIDISVRDQGIGIPEEKQDAIFAPFTQLGAIEDARNPGTGLGLTLVQNLMRLMNGDVRLESQPHVGSVFTVGFPESMFPTGDSRAASTDCQTPTVTEIVTESQPLNILLAEDDLASADSLQSYLEALGHQVDHVVRGDQVVERVRQTRPDLLLLDIHLPNKDGRQILRDLRSRSDTEKLPVFAITAAAMPGDREACLQAGANAYFSKPLRLANLRNQIQHLIDNGT